MSEKIILLADDDSDDRFFIQQAIQSSGTSVRVVETENGLDLLQFLASSQASVALIIIDVNMPKMNGLEATAEIRANPHTARIPVVMLSTSPNRELITKAYEAGVNQFIPKPNTFEEFGELITSLQATYLL